MGVLKVSHWRGISALVGFGSCGERENWYPTSEVVLGGVGGSLSSVSMTIQKVYDCNGCLNK